MKKLSHIIYKQRIPVMILCWLSAIGMGLFLPRLEIDSEVEAMVPRDMPSRLNTDSIENMFGGADNIVLLFEADDILNETTLKRIKNIDKDIAGIPEIDNTMSIFNSKSIKGEQGMMLVDPAILRIPGNSVQREALRNELIGNELVYKVFVSSDFKFAAIIAVLQKEIKNETVMPAIQEVLDRHPGPEKVYLGGMPVVSLAITGDINRDLKFLLPLALILMILTLWVSFRSFNGVFLPFSVVIMSILISMGMMPVLGWKLAIVSVLLPIMLIAIANNYGIHIYNRHLELDRGPYRDLSGGDKIIALWKALAKPVILTGITTIAGILGLLTHIIVPAKQVGILAAIGIAWALIMSLLYIPAYLSGIKSNQINIKREKHLLERGLGSIARQLILRPKITLAAVAAVGLFMVIGIFRLQVEGNTVNFFGKDHIVRKSSDLIDKHMGGSQTISIHYAGDIKDPGLLKRMLNVEEELKTSKGVGQVTSIAGIVKIMSRSLLDPSDPSYDRIPDSRDAIAQYFELYSFSGDPGDFEQLVDFNYENAQMIVRVDDPSSSQVLKVVGKINLLTQNDPAVSKIGGIGLINAEMTDKLISGQNRSLIFALVVVTLLIIVIFKSWRAGLLALIPLLYACIILFGSMGWLGINLDAATALLSSIMIGVGVDYTIHYLWRHQQEKLEGESTKEAILTTLTTTGKGITFNALSVMIGFAALMFSTFNPIRFFGFLTTLSILTCLVGALIIIPAIILIWEPEFLVNKQKTNKVKTRYHEKKYHRHSRPAFTGAADGPE